MKFRTGLPLAIAAFVCCALAGVQAFAQNAYIVNSRNTVSVIDTATNTVTATITVGFDPFGVAVTPDSSKVYFTNLNSSDVSVLDTATNTVTEIPVGVNTTAVAVSPDGKGSMSRSSSPSSTDPAAWR